MERKKWGLSALLAAQDVLDLAGVAEVLFAQDVMIDQNGPEINGCGLFRFFQLLGHMSYMQAFWSIKAK